MMPAVNRALVAMASSVEEAAVFAWALDWHKIIESSGHVVTAVGVITTGLWAVGARRVFSPRMEFEVHGRVFGAPMRQYVVPRVVLRNIGNTRLQLKQKGSGFRVWYALPQAEKPFDPITWSEPVVVQSIFEHHHWLEPGESIVDEEQVMPLPGDWIAAKIEARQCVESRGLFRRKRSIEINATAIVYVTGAHHGLEE